MLAAARFLWNSTRGHRLAPWRSEYLKWRVETYSGMKAETLGLREIAGFMWQQKWELLRFLNWINKVDAETRRNSRA
jgi:hypothetical protein